MSIRFEFLGAAGRVTGSRTLIRYAPGKKLLLDCGLFQGTREEREKNWAPFLSESNRPDSIVITHAHLDHSGYLPRLYREGYRGPVYASEGTCELLDVLLKDAAKLQEEDAEYANRTGHSKHKPAQPLFDHNDAEGVLTLLQPQKRDEWIRIERDVGVRFGCAGHIPGASFVTFDFGGERGSRLVTFSGDIGHNRSQILRPPEDPGECDLLILESTYGGRFHSTLDPSTDFAKIAERTFRRNGVLVIPSFAVGRAQDLLFLIRSLEKSGRIPSVPVILDSPMATKATDIFLALREDHRSPDLFADGMSSLVPAQFENTTSIDESFLACLREGPLVVISASGMLSGGRVLHHLKKRLPEEQNTLLFVGYQAEGSKGRWILDHGREAGTVRIHHQEIQVAAEICSIEGLSAHGDQADLLSWVSKLRRPPQKVICNHGTPEAARVMAKEIQEKLGWSTEALTGPTVFDF
jgi:metallo-beta-lactamase family protein